MAINAPYHSVADLAPVVPVFPLTAALLLPRGNLPLNIFEPRYMAMIDAALAGPRLIAMVQPALHAGGEGTRPDLCGVGCVGRLTAVQETGDGRYLVTLTGVIRCRLAQELTALTPYRQVQMDYQPFAADLVPRAGEDAVDREKLIAAFRAFLDGNAMEADWDSVQAAPNEALINALAMMAPFGPPEKQALLEAPTLRDRAEMLVAMTELALAMAGGGTEQRLN